MHILHGLFEVFNSFLHGLLKYLTFMTRLSTSSAHLSLTNIFVFVFVFVCVCMCVVFKYSHLDCMWGVSNSGWKKRNKVRNVPYTFGSSCDRKLCRLFSTSSLTMIFGQQGIIEVR
jgi:hypothetical protein